MASNNIWQELRKNGPIMVLAPMADVTDAAFRQIIRKYSGQDYLAYTEFVSADGLCSDIGRPKLLRELHFVAQDQPIIAQLFSSKPEKMEQAARLCAELGFAGVDINMGCPDKTIEKQGCGSAMIKNPELAKEIIAAAKRGVLSANPTSPIPVSVKTRIGYNKVELESWAKALLEARPAAIIFHLRTRKEMSKVPAQWDLITIARDLARAVPPDENGERTLILGNGDVETLAEAQEKAEKYQIDGVMIGRGIFGNPWLFSHPEKSPELAPPGRGEVEGLKVDGVYTPTVEEKLRVALEHTELFAKLFRPGETNTTLFNGHTKNFAIMKKHFKAYINNFPDAAELRAELMETETAEQVKEIIEKFLTSRPNLLSSI